MPGFNIPWHNKFSSEGTAMGTEYHDGKPVRRFHFNTIGALTEWIKEIEAPTRGRSMKTAKGYGPMIEAGKYVLQNGDTKDVAAAQALIDKFNEEIPSLRRVWQSSVAGFFPNVPAFLAGEPESMWHMANEESDRAPLRVWVGLTSSSSVSTLQLVKRGAALAAFAIALSERRPVIITPYWEVGDDTKRGTKGNLISWDLQGSPIVLSEVMACLVNPNLTRYLGLHVNALVDSSLPDSGPWFPNAFNEPWMRECLGCDDNDVWLPGIWGDDAMIDNPVAWIKEKVAKYLGEEMEV